ncbi:MAG TPA: MBL fold metallo-hydrolase [Pyrinomonadaceae bacterium]|nr:MBL fold metallo-hydrolase [Pyrinomonadaceae bacterium]
MNQKSATPKDASAVILIKDGKVLWAQRNPNLKFLGGWHAFPGGKTEKSDAEIEVRNCEDKELEQFIVSAVRECFEEVGVLLVRGGEKLTRGQRASLHDDLISGRSTFKEILDHWNLWIDAEDFLYTGFWTTPNFSPIRFKTRFFIAECPAKQTPYAAINELQNIEFITPKDALTRWENSEVLISPPVLISLQVLAEFSPQRHRDTEIFEENIENQKEDLLSSVSLRLCGENLREKSEKHDGIIAYLDLNPHITVFPLRTETLPPATHTNCFIVGRKEFIVIDAASKDVSEIAKLCELLDSMIASGAVCKEIIVSHLHPDHFGGETVLQKHLQTKFGLKFPISAHEITAESLKEKVVFQKFITDNEVFSLKDEAGETFEIKALHTPGHARGHLCFYDESKNFLLSSDNVIATGSVVIAPPEGNLVDYLASLDRMKTLPNLRFLCGSHGSAIFNGKAKIDEYIAHRLEREKQIISALESGAKTPREIVEKVYVGLDEKLVRLAEKSVEAHLEKLRAEARA